MRYIVVLLIVGSVVYFAYENITLKQELQSSQEEVGSMKAELAKTKHSRGRSSAPMGAPGRGGTQAAPSSQSGPQKIVCPHCKGEGQYALKSSANHIRYAGCPLCGGTGHHTIKLPDQSGVYICPDCKGLGKMVDTGMTKSKTGRLSVTIDRRCKGKGYLRK